jgi:hypothetical protein
MRIQARPPSVRPLGAGTGGDFVVEMTSPIARNVLYRAYQALFAIGVQILHTRLRMKAGDAVQTLYLSEFGDTSLDRRRVFEVLTVLNDACEVSSAVEHPASREQLGLVGAP